VQTPTFQLSLLGPFELSGPDGLIDLTSKKLAAMLAFLACTAPQAHSRDKLMTLLWGSHFEAQTRQNLRQALTRLRRVLGDDALISTGESVSLQPSAIASDVVDRVARCPAPAPGRVGARCHGQTRRPGA
jgi:DNA-binding SARP family transcriptional activator